MAKKYREKSLKKRITRTLSMLNFFSLGIMLITMMITLGIVFKVFSIVIVTNAASHMSSQLKEVYMMERKELNITEEFTELTPYTEL